MEGLEQGKQLARKYRKRAVMWVVIPFAVLILTLMLYAIAGFIIQSALYADAQELGYASPIGLGEAGPRDTFAAILNVIFGLIGTLAVIFIPIGIIMAARNISKARQVMLTQFDERSGKGPASEIPDEIRGWSWGAAGLNIIWGTYHGAWLSFLILVPYLNLIWWIFLGLKGRKWAWENMRWESVEEFRRVQRKWDIWGAILFFFPLFIALIFFIIAII